MEEPNVLDCGAPQESAESLVLAARQVGHPDSGGVALPLFDNGGQLVHRVLLSGAIVIRLHQVYAAAPKERTKRAYRLAHSTGKIRQMRVAIG